jgi:hypothetical protein
MEHTVDGGSRDTVRPGNLAQALSAPALQKDRLAVDCERLAPDRPAFEARQPHAGLDALDDQVAFKFRNRTLATSIVAETAGQSLPRTPRSLLTKNLHSDATKATTADGRHGRAGSRHRR